MSDTGSVYAGLMGVLIAGQGVSLWKWNELHSSEMGMSLDVKSNSAGVVNGDIGVVETRRPAQIAET